MSLSTGARPGTVFISADSHMAEPPDLWQRNLPAKFRDQAPYWPLDKYFVSKHHLRAGGWDPHERLKDQAVDGVGAEVMYPTLGFQCYLAGDVELEEACCRVYNDWLIDFCNVNQDRLWGLALISLRNIDHAVAELDRCKKAGLRGVANWIAAPEDLPYSSEHYYPFWDAAQSLEMPLSMHINARSEARQWSTTPFRQFHSVNGHKFDAMTSMFHLIAGRVLERFPRLKVAIAEVGAGWIPFWLQELDYYTASRDPLPLRPSQYFQRQCYSAFINDGVGCALLEHYPRYNTMWSNDYPHPACTWPDSGETIEGDLAGVSSELYADIVCNTAAGLYNGSKIPPPVEIDQAYAIEVREWAQRRGDFGTTSRLRLAPAGN
jgi:predicted TIM-barrel fold metal-dependent hydrolase